MAKTKITNTSPGLVAIPGYAVLGPGRSATVTGNPEDVITALGGFDKFGEALLIEQAPENATLDTTPTGVGIPGTRLVNTTAPLLGGGALSGDLTLSADMGEVGDIAAVTAGGAAAAGILNELARADHAHALGAGLVGDIAASTVGGTAAAGVLTTVARADHKHALVAGTTADIADVVAGGAEAAGASGKAADAAHVHNLPLVTTSVNGSMAATDKVRLDDSSTYVAKNTVVTVTGATTGLLMGAKVYVPGAGVKAFVARTVVSLLGTAGATTGFGGGFELMASFSVAAGGAISLESTATTVHSKANAAFNAATLPSFDLSTNTQLDVLGTNGDAGETNKWQASLYIEALSA